MGVHMMKRYSIAEARNHLPEIVHDVERNGAVEFTRRGKPVAVLMSLDEYQRLGPPRTDFRTAFLEFRRRIEEEGVDIPPEVFAGLRDPSPGRPAPW